MTQLVCAAFVSVCFLDGDAETAFSALVHSDSLTFFAPRRLCISQLGLLLIVLGEMLQDPGVPLSVYSAHSACCVCVTRHAVCAWQCSADCAWS